MVFRALVVSFLLLLGSISTFAAEQPNGPLLADLLKLPQYRAAWIGMLAGATPPAWVEDYSKTFDGPPSPSIAIPVGADSYILAFTCKPNACDEEQLYVLFSPGGAKAWGLLLTAAGKKWLGSPDQSIQDAIANSLE